MTGIISYLKKYRDYSFDEVEFNEVDALILSQFVYLKLDGYIGHYGENKPPVELCLMSNEIEEEKVFMDERYARGNRVLFSLMAESRRYRGMIMQNYSSIVSIHAETQFAALTVYLEKGPTVVLFRGTDENMVGWKEDFNMFLKEPVMGQKLSSMYLNEIGDQLPEKFILAGHSKGGNLAVYAAMNARQPLQDRIEAVYSFDGPGFRPEILESVDFDRIKDRIHKFLPHSSIFGMMLESREDYRVVECSKVGFMQHNPFNWHVEDRHFKEIQEVGRLNRYFSEAARDWFFSLDDDQVKAFVEIWYQIVNEANVRTMLELTREPGKTMLSLLDAYKETDEETKEMARQLTRGLMDAAGATLRYYAKHPRGES